METTEDIVLRHSGRGMNLLREYLPKDYCTQAAREILSWKKGTVLLTTGFYVAGFAETDGPAGTIVVSKALEKLGYHPVIVTDRFCKDFFEPENIETVYLPLTAGEEECRKVLAEKKLVGMISIERCGINTRGDYENMRGISIAENTAKADLLFTLAGPDSGVALNATGTDGSESSAERAGADVPALRVPTIGVGDGGNEIGMGNLSSVITEKLSLVPCRVKVDHLVIASVSNWGAYGIAAELERLSGKKVYSEIDGMTPSEKVRTSIERMVKVGSVDGVTHERVAHVDGFDGAVEAEILDALADSLQ